MDAPHECLAQAGLDVNPPSPELATAPLPPARDQSPLRKTRRMTTRSITASTSDPYTTRPSPTPSTSSSCGVPPTSRALIPAEFECPICCLDFPPEEVAIETLALGCGHRACNRCWAQYLEGKIKDEGESVRIQCLESGCGRVVSVNVVEKLVSEEVKNRFVLFFFFFWLKIWFLD